MVPMEPRDRKGLPELMELRDHKEYKDPLGLLDRKGLQETMELMELTD
jgi:hypothetical protein